MKFFAWLSGILGVAALLLKDRISSLKIESLQRDKLEAKATLDAFEKADRAIAESIRKEDEDSIDTHDFNR